MLLLAASDSRMPILCPLIVGTSSVLEASCLGAPFSAGARGCWGRTVASGAHFGGRQRRYAGARRRRQPRGLGVLEVWASHCAGTERTSVQVTGSLVGSQLDLTFTLTRWCMPCHGVVESRLHQLLLPVSQFCESNHQAALE